MATVPVFFTTLLVVALAALTTLTALAAGWWVERSGVSETVSVDSVTSNDDRTKSRLTFLAAVVGLTAFLGAAFYQEKGQEKWQKK